MKMNFKDLITVFLYNLIISLKHDIMGKIIINLTLVYGSLYKILKEYSGNTFKFNDLNSISQLRVQRYIYYLGITFLNIYNKNFLGLNYIKIKC